MENTSNIVELWPVGTAAVCSAADVWTPAGLPGRVSVDLCRAPAAAGITWVGCSGGLHSAPRCARHIMRDVGEFIKG